MMFRNRYVAILKTDAAFCRRVARHSQANRTTTLAERILKSQTTSSSRDSKKPSQTLFPQSLTAMPRASVRCLLDLSLQLGKYAFFFHFSVSALIYSFFSHPCVGYFGARRNLWAKANMIFLRQIEYEQRYEAQ